MTYGEIKTQFETLLNRRDSTAAQREIWLQQSIMRIQRELRCPALEKSVQVTVDDTTYDEGLAVPSDYLQLIAITVDDGDPLAQADLTTVLGLVNSGATPPTCFTRRGGKWVFGGSPEGGAVIRVDYYAEFSALEADDDENIISIIAPDLIITGALLKAADHYIDKRKPGWEEEFQRIMGDLDHMTAMDTLVHAVVAPAHSYPNDE